MIVVGLQIERAKTMSYWIYVSFMTIRFFFLMGLGATGVVDWFTYLLYGTPKPLILLPVGLLIGVLACVLFILFHFIHFLSENSDRKVKKWLQKAKGSKS